MKNRFFSAIFLLATTSTSAAASFDCEKAASNVERIICSDPEISQLDEQLSEINAQKITESPYYQQSQRGWISTRNTCQDRECVLGLYIRRINFLLPPDQQLAYSEIPKPSVASDQQYEPPYPVQDAETTIDAEDSPGAQALVAQENSVEGQAASEILVPEGPSQGIDAVAATTTLQPASIDSTATNQLPPATASERGVPRLALLAILAIVIVFISIVALSIFGKIVFYFDGHDFAWSLSPAIVAALTGIVVAILHVDGDSAALSLIQKTVIAVGSIAVLLGVWISIYNAIRYNRSVAVGLLVGTCKALVAAFMVFSFFANSGRKHGRDYYKNSESGRRERAVGRSSFVILGFLWFALVNGERTYENKGWELPA